MKDTTRSNVRQTAPAADLLTPNDCLAAMLAARQSNNEEAYEAAEARLIELKSLPATAPTPAVEDEEARSAFEAAHVAIVRPKHEEHPFRQDLPVYALTHGVPHHIDATGEPTDSVTTEVGERVIGLSERRTCLAGLLAREGVPVHACRVVGFYPAGDPTREMAGVYGLPYPETQSDWDDVALNYNGKLGRWIHRRITQRIDRFARERGLFQIDAKPDGLPNRHGMAEFSVTLIDPDVVRSMTDEVGKAHYASVLFSNGHEGRSERADGTVIDCPDVRRPWARTLTVQEMDAVSRVFGYGPFVGDGWSFYFQQAPTITSVCQTARFYGEELDKEAARLRLEAARERHGVAAQFRAGRVEVGGRARGRRRLAWAAKGVALPVESDDVPALIAQHELRLERFFDVAYGPLGADIGEAERERLRKGYHAFKEATDPGLALLRQVADQVAKGREVLLAVEGDQVKTGGHTRSFSPVTYMGTPIAGVKAKRPGHAPEQYAIGGNVQLVQFLGEELMPGVAEALKRALDALVVTTPQDVARLVEGEVSRRRWTPEGAPAELSADLDLLTHALSTGLIDLDTEGKLLQAKGEPVPVGHMRIEASVRSRLDNLIAALIRRTARSFGLEGRGGTIVTVDDDPFALRAAYGLDTVRSLDCDSGVVDDDPSGPVPRVMRGEGWLRAIQDRSVMFLPKTITKQLNGDDDGDIAMSMSRRTWVRTSEVVPGKKRRRIRQRYCRVTAFARYPVVDGLSLLVLPPEWKTPYGEATGPAAELIDALDVHTTADPRSWRGADGERAVPLGTSTHVVRLFAGGQGAKSAVTKTRMSGPVTYPKCREFVMRKRRLNGTGAMTRLQERITARMQRARTKLRRDFQTGAAFDPDMWHLYLAMIRKDIEVAEALEMLLTGFKYVGAIPEPPEGFVTADPHGIASNGELIEAYPLSQHTVMPQWRHVLDRGTKGRSGQRVATADPFDTEAEPLLVGDGAVAGPHDAPTRVLNWALFDVARKGGAVAAIHRALEEVDTKHDRFSRRLYIRLREAYGVKDPRDIGSLPPEVEAHASVAYAALERWRVQWKATMDHVALIQNHALYEADGVRAAEEYLGHASAAIRLDMRLTGEALSADGLAAGILRHWSAAQKQADEVKRSFQRGDGPVGQMYRPYEVSTAGAIALAEGRLAQVFPAFDTEAPARYPGTTSACRAFTRGRPLPGPHNGWIELTDLRYADDNVDGGPVKVIGRYPLPDGEDSAHYVLELRAEDGLPTAAQLARARVRKTDRSSAVLQW